MKSSYLTVSLAVLLALSGCAGVTQTHPPVEMVPPFQFGDTPHQLWNYKVKAWATDTFPQLVEVADRLYIVGRESLAALEIEKGGMLWRTEVGEVASGPALISESLVASLFTGEVVALASSDGGEIWRTQSGGEVLAPARQAGNRLIVQSNNGRVMALDIGSGEIQWLVENSTPALSLRGTAAPTILPGRVFIVDDGCKVRMLSSSDGNPLWERVLAIAQGSNEIEQLIDADSQPVLLGNNIYLACYNKYLFKLAADSSQEEWKYEINTRHDLLLAGATIVLVEEGTSALVGISAVTGKKQWRRTDLSYRALGNPVFWRNLILIGDYEGYVHFLNPENGKLIARFRPSKAAIRFLLPAGERLYIADAKGVIRAFQRQP